VRENTLRVNPTATIIEAASPIFVEDPAAIRGKARACCRGRPDSDPRWDGLRKPVWWPPSALAQPRSSIPALTRRFNPHYYKKYPTTGQLLPAMGYGEQQMRELERDDQCHAV